MVAEETELPILNLSGLKIISLLGRGAKGVVFLVKDDENRQWALKVMARGDGQGEYKRVRFEKQALSLFHHPLLPSLRGVLRTDSITGFAIDYCPGRDLNHLRKLQSEGMFSIELIRFYAAEILLGLEYLHEQGIAYRDLKPENILIQESGHIMLVDFDLSTRLPWSPVKTSPDPTRGGRSKPRSRSWLSCFLGKADVAPVDSTSSGSRELGRSNSFVGTEEYVAPEVIKGDGHGLEVDLWSYGVVLYEMLYGATPFKGGSRKETFVRILTKVPELVGQTTPLRDLIRRLLVKEPAERIGLGQVKAHEFFRGVDWGAVLTLARPPYIPPVRDGDVEGEKRIEDVEAFVQGIFASKGGGKKDVDRVADT